MMRQPHHGGIARSLACTGILVALSLVVPAAASRHHHRRHRRYRRAAQTWTASTYAYGLSADDVTGGEDPVVRRAAVDALGDLNGTAVIVDPNNGRILAMVNQDLALSADYQPCSTTKIAIALAALDQGIINENTPVQVGRHWFVTLTSALAHSNNAYFEALGQRLGFETVSHYERLLGLGEKAGWDIPGEDPGSYPAAPGPGGVAKLSSFGEGIHMSPLQLAAIVSTVANGGTLYWLQHPTTAEQAADFVPRVKRRLNIHNFLPAVQDGMMAAVDYGTARGAYLSDEEILGKTGTCSRDGTRFGLFGSFLGPQYPQLAVVVILRGNGSVYGPRAAEVAGRVYRALDHEQYFAANRGPSGRPAGE